MWRATPVLTPLLLALAGILSCASRQADHGPATPPIGDAIAAAPAAVNAASPPACAYTTRWTTGTLRAPQGGYVVARFSNVEARAQLEEARGELRLNAGIQASGFHLLGYLNLEQDHPMRAAAAIALHDGLVLSAGTPTRVSDARPGQLQIDLVDVSELRPLVPLAGWVPCGALSLEFSFRDDKTDARERRVIQLPENPPSIYLAKGGRARLSTEPGGEPFVELTAESYDRELYLLAREGEQRRVLLHHWNGTLVYGWTASADLRETSKRYLGDIFGATDDRELEICESPDALVLYAARRDSSGVLTTPVEPIGTVDPNTPFVLRAARDDGMFELGAPPKVWMNAPTDVAWLSRSEAPLQCRREGRPDAAAERTPSPTR